MRSYNSKFFNPFMTEAVIVGVGVFLKLVLQSYHLKSVCIFDVGKYS